MNTRHQHFFDTLAELESSLPTIPGFDFVQIVRGHLESVLAEEDTGVLRQRLAHEVPLNEAGQLLIAAAHDRIEELETGGNHWTWIDEPAPGAWVWMGEGEPTHPKPEHPPESLPDPVPEQRAPEPTRTGVMGANARRFRK